MPRNNKARNKEHNKDTLFDGTPIVLGAAVHAQAAHAEVSSKEPRNSSNSSCRIFSISSRSDSESNKGTIFSRKNPLSARIAGVGQEGVGTEGAVGGQLWPRAHLHVANPEKFYCSTRHFVKGATKRSQSSSNDAAWVVIFLAKQCLNKRYP